MNKKYNTMKIRNNEQKPCETHENHFRLTLTHNTSTHVDWQAQQTSP